MLFGLPSETIYPRENMLRISDGKWTTNKILSTLHFLVLIHHYLLVEQ